MNIKTILSILGIIGMILGALFLAGFIQHNLFVIQSAGSPMTAQEMSDMAVKAVEENQKIMSNVVLVLTKCTDMFDSGDTSMAATCAIFAIKSNRYLAAMANMTRQEMSDIMFGK